MKESKMKCAVLFIAVLLIVAISPGNSRQQEIHSLLIITSEADIIVDGILEGETGYPNIKNAPVYNLSALVMKKGKLDSNDFLAVGPINAEIGSYVRVYLSGRVRLPVDPNNPPLLPLYPVIYAIRLNSSPVGMAIMSTMGTSEPAPSSIELEYSEVLAEASEPISEDPSVIGFLRESLSSSDRDARLLALSELQQFKVYSVLTDEDIEQLFKILEDLRAGNGQSLDRVLTLALVGKLGERAIPKIPLLMTELEGRRGQYTVDMVAEICRMQPAPASIAMINRKFSNKNPFTQRNLATLVRMLGKRTRGNPPTFCNPTLLSNLEHGLQNESTFVRQEFILALGELGCEDSETALITFYPQANYDEKTRILYGLARIGTPEAKAFIQWARNNDSQSGIASFAAHMIAYPWSPLFDGIDPVTEGDLQ